RSPLSVEAAVREALATFGTKSLRREVIALDERKALNLSGKPLLRSAKKLDDRSRSHLLVAALLAGLAGVFVFFSVPVGASTAAESHTNLLTHSASPYLLQHAHNPVDWYPWGEEADKKAKKEKKLSLLSIGDSTHYWCHVAERTIYSNPAIAALMNQWFVNIKVDREERPDLDATFMLARQALTGSGGWPNNLFLTPDLKPFLAGSYFPPEDQ